jgi:hypothetical protein
MMPWQVLLVVLEFLAWLGAPPRSLADAAAREAIRRNVVAPSVASFDNSTLPSSGGPDIPPTEPPASPPETAIVVDNEQSWRDRLTLLQDGIAHDEAEVAAVERRLALLQRQVSAQDDPAQQAAMRDEIQRAFEVLAELARRIEVGRRAVGDLREEARRRGVPPGWLR